MKDIFLKHQLTPKIPSGYNFLVWLTHDVDRIRKTLIHSIYYWLKEKRSRHLKNIFCKNNPYWNFEQIMALEDQYRARSTFFFLQETMKPQFYQPKSYMLAWGRYNIMQSKIKELIKNLDKNGWEIGLHGSYQSFLDKNLLSQEKKILESVLGHEIAGARQHYWNNSIPQTWEIQRSIGIKYDATFALKNDIGFKDNIYYPFRPFNDEFLVMPTVIMEYYLLNKVGGNLEAAKKIIDDLIEVCKNKKTVLSVLWHPHFVNPEEFPAFFQLYEYLLAKTSQEGGCFITPKYFLNQAI